MAGATTPNINRIITELSTIAHNHLSNPFFGFGPISDLNASNNSMMPIIWLEPDNSTLKNTVSGFRSANISFKLYCLDKINKGDSNFQYLMSDMFQLGAEVAAQVRESASLRTLFIGFDLSEHQVEPMMRGTDEDLNGYIFHLKFQVPIIYTPCNNPISPLSPFIIRPTPGPTGNQGNQGNIGIGSQGPQGNQGLIGVTGSQGPSSGGTGSGSQGPQGFQGNQGLIGSNGTQGFKGNQGFQGPTGPGNNFTTISFTLDQSILATMSSYPYAIPSLPAPGIGYAWQVISCAVAYVFNTFDYSWSQIQIMPVGGFIGNSYQYFFTMGEVGASYIVTGIPSFSTTSAYPNIIENEGLQVQTDSDDGSGGDATVTFYITLIKITL